MENVALLDRHEEAINIARLIDLVHKLYGFEVAALQSLDSDSGKHIYQIEQASGQQLALRAYPAMNDGDTVQNLAAMLLFLEEQGYPAERVIRSLEGDAVSIVPDGWQLLITSFIEGTLTDYSPASLRLLGTMLGRLHALQPPSAAILPLAENRPATEIPWAMGQLTSVAAQVPGHLQSRYETLLAALHTIDFCEDLPRVVIHNDCHPANTVSTPTGEIVLIDWEGAGMGSAILDVGFLLISCDKPSLWVPKLEPDPRRVAAIIDGYCQHHLLTLPELNKLPDAIRFRSIVYGACSFAESISRYGREDESDWWWKRYVAAEEVAERASGQFEAYL